MKQLKEEDGFSAAKPEQIILALLLWNSFIQDADAHARKLNHVILQDDSMCCILPLYGIKKCSSLSECGIFQFTFAKLYNPIL